MIASWKNYFFVFAVSLFVVLRPAGVVLASDKGANATKLQFLLNLHLEMKSGIGSYDLINSQGQKLLEQTANFLATQSALGSSRNPELVELEKHQKYLANYFQLKNRFEVCVDDKSNKRQMSSRILESACQSMLSEAIAGPCQDSLYQFRSLIDFNALAKVTKEKARPAFQGELTKLCPVVRGSFGRGLSQNHRFTGQRRCFGKTSL